MRKDFSNLEFITGKFFLTKASAVPEPQRTVVGPKLYGLDEWRPMIEIGAWGRWSEAQVRTVAERISSAASVALNPEISRIGPVSGQHWYPIVQIAITEFFAENTVSSATDWYVTCTTFQRPTRRIHWSVRVVPVSSFKGIESRHLFLG